ncbi:MAG TPA: hypothetical protein VKR26_10475, partial [Terriglobales bacterium]|nr:hypothetical protein [Terriglobales bacterium]
MTGTIDAYGNFVPGEKVLTLRGGNGRQLQLEALAEQWNSPFAMQAGIPDLIDLSKPANVWGLDGRNLQSYFRRKGFDSKLEPPKAGTSGRAEVFK